ncbi:MAG: helix-turn-helix domain-containing protein [Marinilabiliaceae bacterium]|jgi:AraC-like DNA-binding protein|nr:helix-turn-helix domain-containing protein [Marinilabiliaceae bacterium]
MEIIEPIIYIGLSQTFFTALLLGTKKPSGTANKLMATLMFMLFFDLVFVLIKIKIIDFYAFPFIAFTYGPILFLYVHFMIHPGRKFNFLNLLHFIPFLVFFVVSVVFRQEDVFTNLEDFFVQDKIFSLRIIYGLCFFLSMSVYSIIVFIMISRHQKNLKNLLSYSSGMLTLNWLKILSISFYVSYVILFILGGLNIIVRFLPFDPYYTIFVFIALFSFIYGFYVVKQPGMLDEFIEEKANTGSRIKTANNRVGYIKSGLKKAEAEKLLKKLLDFTEREKPFLDRDLNIHTLSELTSIPKHHITEVLNEYYGKNFFTFINEFRVTEVISRMKDPANKNFTILAIAYDSGFNSKSTFNTIFKSITGLTPSQYIHTLPG